MRAVYLGTRPFLACLLASLQALNYAQAAGELTPGDQNLVRERQERLLDEQRRRLEQIKELTGKPTTDVGAEKSVEALCFPVRQIFVNGAEHLSDFDRQKIVRTFQGQCLGTSQLDDLLKAITNHYLDKGLVTSRAYLPQQDLSSGELKVLVVEGHLEKLRAAAESGLSPRELAMSFPGREGELLNLRDIEQMVDQLNRLPSNQAQMELVPGQAAGGSGVLVRNTAQKPWRA